MAEVVTTYRTKVMRVGNSFCAIIPAVVIKNRGMKEGTEFWNTIEEIVKR